MSTSPRGPHPPTRRDFLRTGAAGPFLTGVMVLYTGSFEYAISVLSLVYLLGPVTLLFARETRGRQLA